MAKSKDKSGKKRARSLAPQGLFEKRRGPADQSVGDLRQVRAYLEAYRAGDIASLELVQQMGRDAAFPALAYAEEVGDPELIGIARRLVAVPPEVHTNLYALREASVDARVESAALVGGAPPLAELVFRGRGAVALFDPLQVRTALAKGGRPRQDSEARNRGTIALLTLAAADPVEARFRMGAPPDGTAGGAIGRLRVGSGVVCVGAPEASDGPRLGTVRLDPLHTALDGAIDSERAGLAKLGPGLYAVRAFHPPDATLEVWVYPDPRPHERLAFESDPGLGAVPLVPSPGGP